MSHDLSTFHSFLLTTKRMLVVAGAGLSAPSGIPTYRGAGGFWRTHVSRELATPQAFNRDPALVWQFYQYRRSAALAAKPNPAHYALAALSRKHPSAYLVTQNVDGLSRRAGHDKMITHFHGDLFDLKCDRHELGCDYLEEGNRDEIVPFDEGVEVKREQLPKCPKCKKGLLRPGVVWFGEGVDQGLDEVEAYMKQKVDLCLIVGTSGMVQPAASFSEMVKSSGGRVALVDLDCGDRLEGVDWAFEGDAAELVPKILEPIIGELEMPEEGQNK